MPIPHFFYVRREKDLLKSQNEVTKPEQNGRRTALGSHWLSSLLSTRSEVSKFFRHQLEPKHGCFCVSFHPCSHHLKHSFCVQSGLLHHSYYCHGLAGWIQPLCYRFCSALWSFDSRVSSMLIQSLNPRYQDLKVCTSEAESWYVKLSDNCSSLQLLAGDEKS